MDSEEPAAESGAIDDTAVIATDSADPTDSEPEQPIEGEAGIKCPTPPIPDPVAADRTACKFAKGAKVATTLGITPEVRAAIPLTHLVIVMNENRSFDHYFGKLSIEGQPEALGFPDTFSNKDAAGKIVKPFHQSSTCVERDPPHGWTPMHAKWNLGKMDGFITASDISPSNGHYALGYLNKSDLPFYNWLANTYAMSDRYFSSVIGPTWPNRDYLYAGTSDGVINTFERKITVPTIFDALDTKKVKWAIYGDGGSRAGCVSVESSHPNHKTFTAFLADVAAGTLPPVSFLDPTGRQDEHPGNSINGDVQGGEAWARSIYEASRKSALWPKMAVIFTYDEAGGFFDHLPPPKACLASASQTQFDRLGFRVPLMIASAYARPHFVSHKTHDHTSITRLIELLHDLPAMTGRDANADALLDLFDFNCPTMLTAPVAPASGKGGCP
jgi:phospholipase C